MAPPKEEPESSPALPRPELNPLLNPVLGDNMGKWAEVYFTSAPEKREEAVQDLIRELESGDSRAESTGKGEAASVPDTRLLADQGYHTADYASEDFHTAQQQMLGHCDACGHDNPATHQFCGMCGGKLLPEEAAVGSRIATQEAEHGSKNAFFDLREGHPTQDAPERFERDSVPPLLFDQPADDPDELAHLRRISGSNEGNDTTFTWNLEPASASPFRIYFGTAVVAIVLAVVYLVWHGSQNPKRQQQGPPPSFAADTEPQPAPPSATAANVAPPASATPAAATPAAATAAPAQPATAPPPSKASNSTEDQPHRNLRTEQPSEDKPIASNSQPGPLGNVALGNGSEELATAQRYLSSASGVQRNSAEAAQWLWKSVAKHNSEATLLLADLYLRGDGVSKNCDQARVLLDSAARKGISRAGERLRNLQAFGCQ